MNAAEVFGDLLFERAWDLATLRRKVFPEEDMVPVLAGIVEDRRQFRLAVAESNDLLERQAGKRCVLLDEAVQRRDIGLVVLAVVEFDRLGAHAVFSECCGCIGKGGKFEGHDQFLCGGGDTLDGSLVCEWMRVYLARQFFVNLRAGICQAITC
ncbi:hypothetical protein D9M72_514160 [compost metagenome]